MNHFMLPESRDGRWGATCATLRCGNFAMEKLINDILKLGGSRGRLEVKLFGGASLMGACAIGLANGEFVLRYLKAAGQTVAAQDLFGVYPRRVHCFPSNGRAVRRKAAVVSINLLIVDDPALIRKRRRRAQEVPLSRLAEVILG